MLPIGYGLAIYGAVWLFGLGGIDEAYSRNWLSWYFFGTLLNCFAALGEEIGWRGFLVGRLAGMTSFTNVSLISGGIWALWHMPLILFADYNSGGPGWWLDSPSWPAYSGGVGTSCLDRDPFLRPAAVRR